MTKVIFVLPMTKAGSILTRVNNEHFAVSLHKFAHNFVIGCSLIGCTAFVVLISNWASDWYYLIS
ncbi:hypothetical protein T10_10626 [Trichinella papuae]|uniref:Uncharacterized protein n=1 Tax=Trichinella papuae TaxID=268474 RepID=A0A0V1M5E0_9BILA|nr:hypothetical protein T10_10626 [Trichinella papuae]